MAPLMAFLLRRPSGKLIAALAALVGFGLALLSATPLPGWLYVAQTVTILLWLGTLLAERTAGTARFVASSLTILIALLVLLIEFPHWLKPTMADGKLDKIYVIGDSISAGVNSAIDPWPMVLQKTQGVPVSNLAVAGADLSDAREQADRLPETPALVVIEMGGNDLLRSTPVKEFDAKLNQLLEEVCRPTRKVVMLELPLLPLQNAYGAAQRRAADRYGVALIPKRCFAAVLRQKGATIDGLHLSASGHERMAEMIWGVIAPVIVRPSAGTH